MANAPTSQPIPVLPVATAVPIPLNDEPLTVVRATDVALALPPDLGVALPPDPGVALPADTGIALPALVVPRRRPVEEPLAVQPYLGFWAVPGLLWRWFGSLCEWTFGAVTLILGLSVLAAVPVLQFLSLGYLLEAGARVARTGRITEGFVGVRLAARVGSIVLGTWLILLPLRFLSSLHLSAEIIDPASPAAGLLGVGLTVLTVLGVLHIGAACARGGKLRYFLWPFGNPIWLARRLWCGGFYTEARDAVWDFVMSLRLPYYFWLGLRGFTGAFLWLAIPVTLIALGRQFPLLGLLGALLLIVVIVHVGFLQMQFAAQNRFRALFDLWGVWNTYLRAPWACATALFLTLLFALPLYFLKIEMIPRETAWLPSLFFVMFMFPSRLLTGWAVSRALRRPRPRHWFFWLTAPAVTLPTAAVYTLLVFFTQYTAWDGIWSLYEQHAFLLPVPFMGM